MEIKNLFYRFIAFFLLILFLPLFLLFYILVKMTSRGPFLFKQKRMGKDKKIFTIYKIRTMVEGADNLKLKYKHLNEYKLPIFKIRNDPRYTRVGRFLAHTGLDEIPQFINVLVGDMSLVGPRALPVTEAMAIPSKYKTRFSVLPGVIPPWLTYGHSALKSDLWLKLDLKYVKEYSFFTDIKVITGSIIYILGSFLK